MGEIIAPTLYPLGDPLPFLKDQVALYEPLFAYKISIPLPFSEAGEKSYSYTTVTLLKFSQKFHLSLHHTSKPISTPKITSLASIIHHLLISIN